MNTFDLTRHVLLFAVLAIALYQDLAHGRLDNTLTFGGMALGLALHTLAGGWGGVHASMGNPRHPGLCSALMGGAVAFALFLFPVLMGGFGAGDLKLMTAVGVLSGLRVALTVLLLVTATGAAMAVALLIWKGRLLEGLRGTWGILRRRPVPQTAARIPFRYVPAIAAGTLWAWMVHYA